MAAKYLRELQSKVMVGHRTEFITNQFTYLINLFTKFDIRSPGMNDTLIQNKLATLPDNLKSEVEDFIDFLLSKKQAEITGGKPVFGSAKGMFVIKPDFDEPLEDFKEYM